MSDATTGGCRAAAADERAATGYAPPSLGRREGGGASVASSAPEMDNHGGNISALEGMGGVDKRSH